MKKVLITGITGFAGSHLAELLVSEKEYAVVGIHSSDRHLDNLSAIKQQIHLEKVNLLDQEQTSRVVGNVKPDIVFHLAASTFVGDSFKKPAEFITNNVTSQISVLEALREHNLSETKIVIISSAHVYGDVSERDIPIDESTPFRPDNPYSVSKITQDYLGLSYMLSYNQHIVRLRPFNHIGSRLSENISVSRWAKAIAEIEKNKREPVLHVGNLTTKRDFTDVRDMVKAYLLASEHCQDGEAYNIGTGVSHTMQEMLDILLGYSNVQITVEKDPVLFRPSDIPELRADVTKFTKATGWRSQIQIEQSLRDILDYWRGMV